MKGDKTLWKSFESSLVKMFGNLGLFLLQICEFFPQKFTSLRLEIVNYFSPSPTPLFQVSFLNLFFYVIALMQITE